MTRRRGVHHRPGPASRVHARGADRRRPEANGPKCADAPLRSGAALPGTRRPRVRGRNGGAAGRDGTRREGGWAPGPGGDEVVIGEEPVGTTNWLSQGPRSRRSRLVGGGFPSPGDPANNAIVVIALEGAARAAVLHPARGEPRFVARACAPTAWRLAASSDPGSHRFVLPQERVRRARIRLARVRCVGRPRLTSPWVRPASSPGRPRPGASIPSNRGRRTR